MSALENQTEHSKSESIFSSFGVNLFTAFFIFILEIIFVLAFTALMYSGELTSQIPRALGFIILGDAVLCGIAAFFSSNPGAIGVEQDTPGAMLAVITAGIIATLSGAATQQFATVTLLIVSTTLLTGLLLLTLGYFKLGGIVRFLPYPVIGGFFGRLGLAARTRRYRSHGRHAHWFGLVSSWHLNAMAPRSAAWDHQSYRFAKSTKAVRDSAFDVDRIFIVLRIHMDDESLDDRFACCRLVIGLTRLFLDLGISTRPKLSLPSELVRAPGATADHHPHCHDLCDWAPLKLQRHGIVDQKRSRP